MKYIVLLVAVAFIGIAGCQNTNEPIVDQAITTTVQDMAEATIIKAIVDEWVAAGKPMGDGAWYSGYNIGDDDAPSKAGDDDGPNRPRTACSVSGMPRCSTLSNGMDKCKDMCGATFYVVEYAPGESVCVSTYGAFVYSCNGSNY